MIVATPHGSYDWCSLPTMHETIVNMQIQNPTFLAHSIIIVM
jgi:hypothetical protein